MSHYTAEALYNQDNELADVRLHVGGKVWHVAGRDCAKREHAMLRPLLQSEQVLPVLLGSGLGHGLELLLATHQGPVAVVDKEGPILGITKCNERFAARENLLWVHADDPSAALKQLSIWQMEQRGLPFVPLVNPVYQRLDNNYYGTLREQLAASRDYDYWTKARYPKFRNAKPRILLITSQYFLMGEIVTACKRLDVEHHFINLEEKELASSQFLEALLKAVVEFRPDFVFTINHLGVDREGVLMELLERLQLPLASWFVDNPHLILYLYNKLVTPITTIFTWDADNIPSLHDLGFGNVHYLPLGTDIRRFTPPARSHRQDSPIARISFVGNSMHYKVGHRLKTAKPGRALLLRYRQVAAAFSASDEPSVGAFLAHEYPTLFHHFEQLDSAERRLAFEAMITWEATRQYRKTCLERILPFNPLIAGDQGWKITFKHTPHQWRWHHELNYYADLPRFYPRCDINFNCTSKQMKGAVNQRVFDVPATGAFLLTDWRSQIEKLFEPDKEVVCFQEPEAIPELVEHYLAHPRERAAVAEAARKRILAEHTYEHRLQKLIHIMRQTTL